MHGLGAPCRRDPAGWHGSKWPGRVALALLFVCLTLTHAPTSAQTITGRLPDENTNVGISGSDLALLDTEGQVVRRTVSADSGTFTLRAPGPGLYRIRASRLGYATTVSPFIKVNQAESVHVEFRVPQAPVELPELTVVARRRVPPPSPYLARKGYYWRKHFYGREGLGLGTFLDGKELRPSANTLSDVLRGSVPGISVRGDGLRELSIMGRWGCPVTLYLNGVLLGKEDGGMIPPASEITAVEVYLDAESVPPAFMGVGSSSGSGCGVVAVWTVGHKGG